MWSPMRSATASTPSMSSDSPLTGPRHSVARPRFPFPAVTRPLWSGCTAGTASTMKWIAARSPASTRLWPISAWPTTVVCDKCCTTTSPGRLRQRCPATTTPPMMCQTASASRTGHGTGLCPDAMTLSGVTRCLSAGERQNFRRRVTPDRDA